MKTYPNVARAIVAAVFTLAMAACSGNHNALPPTSGAVKGAPPQATHAQAASSTSGLTLGVDYLKFEILRTQQSISASVNTGTTLYASSSNTGITTVSPASVKASPSHPAVFTVTAAAWGDAWITITDRAGLNGRVFAAVSPWIGKTVIPSDLAFTTLVTIGNTLYAAQYGFSDYPQPASTALEAYNPATDTWQAKAPLDPPRAYWGAGTIGGLLYAVGGLDASTWTYEPTVKAYNPATDTWANKAPLPVADYVSGVASLNNVLYAVIGSWYPLNLNAYNPSSNKWTTLGTIPGVYGSVQAVVLDKQLYIIDYNGDMVAYNPNGKTWAVKNGDLAAQTGSVVVVNGVLYEIALKSGSMLPDVFAYNPATNTWTKKNAPLPQPYALSTAGAVGDSIYLVGAHQCSFASCTEHTWVWKP